MNTALSSHGHVVAARFVPPQLARFLFQLLRLRRWRREFRSDDQVPTADSHWGDSTLDALLLALQPDVEAAAGCALLPTYAYARLYGHGNSLPRHRDRAAAEVAVTIHAGSDGGVPPPLCLAPDIAVTQAPGDAVIYLGDRVEHWRDAYQGSCFGQLFLNYVRADGPRRHLVYDGRHGEFPGTVAR